MSGKDLKRSSYWFKDKNKKAIDVKRSKLKDPQTTEPLSKLERKIEVCIFNKINIYKYRKSFFLTN